MKLRILERALRNFLIRFEIFVNRRLGREFIPLNNETFCIETTSACNLKCRFCAYEKKQGPRVSMAKEQFINYVGQAVDLGYKEFHLTPCTGDVFMDRHLYEKLSFLETNQQVRAYHFFTNLTVPDTDGIRELMSFKKLTRLVISIYGHDEPSFIALTKSSPKIYRRLLANLEQLLALQSEWPFALSIGFRSTFDVPQEDKSELMKLVRRFRHAGVGVNSSHGIYNNWGGYITQEDVKGLNLRILSANNVYKSGPCVKLFDSFQVTSTGVVNGCSCRDVDTTLKIGDLRQTPLSSIVCKSNSTYMQIIEDQQKGNFPRICSDCDFYRSIYHQPSNFRRHKLPTISVREFLEKHRERPQ